VTAMPGLVAGGEFMKKIRLVLLLVLAVAMVRNAAAAEPDAALIAKITGLTPDVKNGIAKVSVPRGDLGMVIDGAEMQPFQGLTSWAAFQAAGDQTMVMGDIVLTEPQVNPAMSAALDNGLQVTALHNHFFFDRPHVFFMHIGGMGTTEQLSTGVRKIMDAANAAPKATGFAGVSIPKTSTIDPKPLEAILGGTAQAKDGVAKFSFGRKTSMHGTEVGEAMGVNTWAAFGGSQQAAVVDGDFAMLEDELQDVLKALRHANINVVAIHNHMTHEEPRIMFLHFWAKGPAEELARGIKAALDTQKK
jgi:Domain of Unknown Function (DUF1259)